MIMVDTGAQASTAESQDKDAINTAPEGSASAFDPELVVYRNTPELVIGMVGAVGSGVSFTSQIIKSILSTEFDYDVEIIKASEIIKENAAKVGELDFADAGSKRIVDLQKIGTALRRQFGQEYIAAKAIEKIAVHRSARGGYDSGATKVPVPKSRRRATIIDSLKHKDEANILRRVYGGIYWQFTVFAPESVREDRLKRDGIERKELVGIFTRDENDTDDHGQQVSKTAFLSDFFVRNDGENDERLKEVIQRFLSILFNLQVHTPTADEAGMYAAVSASGKSACLSRQVGAALYSETGELLSVGWNDVPKFKGGLYRVEDEKDDHRCFKWGKRLCHNDRKKGELYVDIFEALDQNGLLAAGVNKGDVRKVLLNTPVKSLIEYSRSIHAEMEAIVSAARAGKTGLVGGTLYSTTYPCHNCARHIVAAGIKRVYYIEPYSKSLALELHSDAITDSYNVLNKVQFLQYEGVGPDCMLKLFHHGVERKENGAAKTQAKQTAIPVLPPPLDGFTTHEKRVIERLKGRETGAPQATPA